MLAQCLLRPHLRVSIHHFTRSSPRFNCLNNHAHKSTSSRLYATHRDVSSTYAARRFKPSPAYRSPQINASSLIRPLLFTVLFTGTSFSLAYYLDTRTPSSSSYSSPSSGFLSSLSGGSLVLPGLIAANILVFGAHQVPSLLGGRLSSITYKFLSRYGYMDVHTASRHPTSLLTSGFSHSAIWHLSLNMIGLYTIGNTLVPLLGSNQFLAFYTSGICVSSMAQLCIEYLRLKRGRSPIACLGASGGVYALLGAVAWYAPNASVYLLFLPFIPLQLGYVYAGMMAMDTVGLIAGWRTFGHAAHLAGGLSGLGYGVSGVPEAWLAKRRESMRRYLSRWGR